MYNEWDLVQSAMSTHNFGDISIIFCTMMNKEVLTLDGCLLQCVIVTDLNICKVMVNLIAKEH